MNQLSENHTRVLAIDPSYREFGYAVLEGPNGLLDYGVRTTRRDKNAASLREIARLIDYWQPDVLAIEDYTAKGSRRCLRVPFPGSICAPSHMIRWHRGRRL